MQPLVAAAARNYAIFCDRVCRAQGLPSRFLPGLWRASRGAPPLFPDAVTLEGDNTSKVTAEIRALAAERPRAVSVQDSAAALDLTRDFFTPLFDAQWIAVTRPMAADPAGGSAARVSSASDLAQWESLWRRGESLPQDHVQFPHALIQRADFEVLALMSRDAKIAGGGILFKGAGVVQISNGFVLGQGKDRLFRALASAAGRLWPELPVVTSASGDWLDAAVEAGFARQGKLRVWSHAGS